MIIETIKAGTLAIPFNTPFRHAAATRAETQTLWVEARARDGRIGFGEGCPRDYVTGESLDSAHEFASAHLSEWVAMHDAGAIADWNARHCARIDANPAAWTAIELALLDLLGKVEEKSVEAVLGLPELAGTFRYTAVLGDMSPRHFEAQLAHYRRAGFQDFKIKLAGDAARDLAKVRALAAAGIAPHAVRADANNLWNDAAIAIRYLAALDYPFLAIEEPLQAGDYAGMRRVALALDTKIILDESLLRLDQLWGLAECADKWIANVRVSKMGGLLRSLEFVKAARRQGLQVIVGAHVGETSLLTRAALTVAANASGMLVAQEGAYGTHLLSRDVVEHPVMFGQGGLLDTAALGGSTLPGFGLAISQPLPHAGASRAKLV